MVFGNKWTVNKALQRTRTSRAAELRRYRAAPGVVGGTGARTVALD